jgi:hypothetical protein
MDLSPFIHSTNIDVSISVQMVAGFVGLTYSGQRKAFGEATSRQRVDTGCQELPRLP